jgi:hypothetical protein
MRYPMPNFPCEFEIPDCWLAEAGMKGFTPSAPSFRSSPDAVLVPLIEIVPPPRSTTTPKDCRGFDRSRLVRILRGFVNGDEIEAVPLFVIPEVDYAPYRYRYRTRDGHHRFYASVAAGFEYLPGSISVPW